ncbi:uncharacterized protein A4U43_C04F13760 [Asparagus officinalis]|uniref:Uncharacterized protein n=1 Tax=Asparagus officinalis TaxID=4686 RepID=A0A5P1F5C1_ASPOF|nr:uncharacterized protein A4U43_C04F13760 [Asparagus officinalis]
MVGVGDPKGVAKVGDVGEGGPVERGECQGFQPRRAGFGEGGEEDVGGPGLEVVTGREDTEEGVLEEVRVLIHTDAFG